MAGTSTTTFVRIINSTEINTLGTITTVFNIGQSGASAYQSYLVTTTDDPKLTEAEWSAGFVQLQSDWEQGDSAAKDFIKNKPTIPTIDPNTVIDPDYNHTDNNYDDAAVLEVAKIADKANSSDVTTALGNKADLVNGLVPSSQLPSYVDDVIEVANFAALPLVGESGKIYITQDDNLTYRWSGTGYAEISKSLALGETSGTAYRGDIGKAAYDHSQTTGNPHGTNASDVGAAPALTTDQNYVSDAELEVLQETSGVNTGDETQDTIGDLIELTELATVTDTTKIAASDSAFLKWFSGLTIYNYLKGKFDLVYASIANYFSKTESDRRFVNQNGGTIYHITRWFTPTSNLQIEAGGLTAQQVGATQFTAAMIGAKLKLTNGVNEPIITAVDVPNRRITLSYAVDASFFGQSVAVADWGVYNLDIYQRDGNTYKRFFNSNAENLIITGNSLNASVFATIGGATQILSGHLKHASGGKITWQNAANVFTGVEDLGLRRISAGLMEIFDGVTNGALRDLKLRSLFADKIILNALNTAPTSATDTGTLGEVRITADYIYVCVATNTWKRTLIETW